MSTPFFHKMPYVTFPSEKSASLHFFTNFASEDKVQTLKLLLEPKIIAGVALVIEFHPSQDGDPAWLV